jgi:DNA-binding NarL/FixJ family response regulator
MKVLVAHYASIICHGICSVIADTDDFEVCAKTDNAEKARQLFEFHRPRVVIVGRAVGGRDGIDLIKHFHKMDPKAAILMMCASEDSESVHRVWKAGALGYLRTMDSDEELVRAMRNVVAGEHYVSEQLKQKVFKRVATGGGKSSGAGIDKLSDRERQVFFQIGKGARLSEIASQMQLSARTVEEFQRRIKSKLGSRDTAELREKAARWANKRDLEQDERSMAEAIA